MRSTSTQGRDRRRKRHKRAFTVTACKVAVASALFASASCGSPQPPPAESPSKSSSPASAQTLLGPSAQQSAQVLDPNRQQVIPPETSQAARVTLLPRAPRTGDTLTAEVESSDPSQNEFLAYRWFVNGEENPGWRGKTFAGGFKRGDEVSVVVSLPGISAPDSVLTDSVRIGNSPPQVEKLESPCFEEGRYTTRIVASDPDGDPLSFSVVKAPEELAIDDAGRITWTPAEDDLGRHEVVVSIRDDSGGEIVYTYAFTVDRQ